MSEVLDVGGAQAGGIMLAGQITDGIVTPIVGLFSDKFTTRIGKRKPWYIGGTAIVAVSFGFIWQNCLICIGNNSEGLKVFWYALFASLFNIGWA
jgi:Na+/melibiose symporter-like transporter